MDSGDGCLSDVGSTPTVSTKFGTALTEETVGAFSFQVVRIQAVTSSRQRLDPRTLVHDAIVTSVRLRLSYFWDGSWIPERVIKQDEYPQIPDGLLVFQSGKKVAVEVENSPKDKTRFFQNMERWRKTDFKLVLFVATTTALVARIEGYLKEGPQGLPLARCF